MAHIIVRLLLASSFALFVYSYWQKGVLPERATLREELQEEPAQKLVSRAPFETTVNDIAYKIQPLYSYDLSGLVVSMHDAQGVVDRVHAQWKDNLNVADLCVVWGNNVRSGVYREIDFSSGQYVCAWQTSTLEVAARFDGASYSNNHLLTDDPAIAYQIRHARIGDQIHFRGYLAEYSHNHGFPFKRGTSTTRTDDGDGACETVYVESFEYLQRGGEPWRTLVWVALAMFVLSFIAWVRLPVRFNH